MINVKKYVGIPWKHLGRTSKGIDCYGLAQLIYKEELNIILPDYYYPVYRQECVKFTPETFPILNCIEQIPFSTEKVQEYDMLWLKIRWEEIVNHIGIYAGDGYFLEVNDPAGTILSKVNRRSGDLYQILRVDKQKVKELVHG